MANRTPRRLDSNAILSITATIVSICALFVAAYQTILMREQQSAAVWPKLVISHGYVENFGDSSFYFLRVRNVGIGPAIIRKVEINGAGQKFTIMDTYVRTVLKQHKAGGQLYFDVSDLLPDDVIPQGEKRELFNTNKSRLAAYFVPSRTHFKMTIDYESVYGEKWQAVFPR